MPGPMLLVLLLTAVFALLAAGAITGALAAVAEPLLAVLALLAAVTVLARAVRGPLP